MSVNASVNKYPVDALLILAPMGGANVTATAASPASIQLDILGSYWDAGKVATTLQSAVVIEVTTWDHTTGDETYVATVEVAVASGFGSPFTVATQAITAPGRYVMIVDRDAVQAALGTSPADGYLRLKMTLAGTTPIIAYSAYVAPLPC